MINTNTKTHFLFFFVAIAIIGGTIFGSSLLGLATAVLHREGSSHGVFVPFLSCYLIWLKFDKIKSIRPQADWLLGGLFILFSVFLFTLNLTTQYSSVFTILSFLFVIGGLTLFSYGLAMFKEVAFPLFFLATMIPIPVDIYSQVATVMRMVTTWGSVMVSKSFGVPLYREEYHIFLPGVNLFVANSCSGIRYLLSYFVFSLVYAAIFKQSVLGRLVIVLGSIPLAIFAGIVRLSTIFLAAHYINPVMAEQRPHIIISWAVFAIILFGIISIDQYISKKQIKVTKKVIRSR